MTAATIDVPAALAAMETSPDYRVLRRFVPRRVYNDEPWNLGSPPKTKVGVYVDVESTGLDTEADEIIEVSLVPFTYDPASGIVFEVRPPVTFFEEPRRKLSPDIIDLTGITPEMVAGQRIDDVVVNDIAKGASLAIAHNADYDRRMMERRLPSFCEVPWACSQREIPWQKFGVRGVALPNILMSACGEFMDEEHRAAVDCQAGVHILANAELEGRTALSYLLESARAGAHRVCAVGSPMEAKGVLRARQYHALYMAGRFQYWYKEVAPADVDAEMAWCREEAFASPVLNKISAKHRYSVRADQ